MRQYQEEVELNNNNKSKHNLYNHLFLHRLPQIRIQLVDFQIIMDQYQVITQTILVNSILEQFQIMKVHTLKQTLILEFKTLEEAFQPL